MLKEELFGIISISFKISLLCHGASWETSTLFCELVSIIFMDDFQRWIDNHTLLHLPTRGANFTWSNGRKCNRNTEKRLDKVVCSKLWIDHCTSLSCLTLVKHKSNHYTILLDFQSSDSRFASQFRFMSMWSKHSDCEEIISYC